MQTRSFSLVGPKTWNGLPVYLRHLPNGACSQFHHLLKTVLFRLAWVQIFENKIATNNRIKKILRKHWLKFTNTYPYFKNLWPNPPIIAFKNSRSIRDYLISSKHPPPWHDTTTKNYEKFTALDELNLEHLLALIN